MGSTYNKQGLEMHILAENQIISISIIKGGANAKVSANRTECIL